MKVIFKVVLYLAAAVGVERFCHFQTDGFAIQKIRSEVAGSFKRKVKPEISEMLSQKFFYLASGGSCYAFESADGKYVLKLFKQHHLKGKKRVRVFESCRLAFEEFKEETGLLFAHLDKSEELKIPLTLVDKLGISHELQADEVEFLLQKKAEMAYSHIDRLMGLNDLEGAKRAIDQILLLSLQIAEKGIKDLDPNVETNLGFVEGRAIKIDVGPLVRDVQDSRSNKRLHKQLIKPKDQLKARLESSHPELYQYLKNQEEDYESLCRRKCGGAS